MDPAPEAEGEILTWEEVYRLITPHEELLKALLAPHQTLEDYYLDLLERALKAGFNDPNSSSVSSGTRSGGCCGESGPRQPA